MEKLSIILLLALFCISANAQYTDNFDSFDGSDEWMSPGGNTGSNNGWMSFNLSGEFISGYEYIFESPEMDFTGCEMFPYKFKTYLNIYLRYNQDYLYIESYYSGSWHIEKTYTGVVVGQVSGYINPSANKYRIRLTVFDESATLDGNYAELDYFELECGGIPTPLPIELTMFNATGYDDNHIKIEWVTETEINNNFFLLERSYDAINFQPICKVLGAGNSYSKLSYKYVDIINILGTPVYYRLKQVDFDGTISISEIVAVKPDSKQNTHQYYDLLGRRINDNEGFLIGNRTIKLNF